MKIHTTYDEPERHTYLDTTLDDLHHHRILATLMQYFDLRPGDAVIEIGSGSGRHTEWLLRYGLHVTAVEPDPRLVEKLQRRLGRARHLRVLQSDISGIHLLAADVRAVCGFHLLHHLDAPALTELADAVRGISTRASDPISWFFLEPNCYSPLYPLQILITPGMRFAEEVGIWKNDYRSALDAIADNSCELGSIGLFPPRAILAHLPAWLLERAVHLKRGRSLFRLYTVYGQRRKP